MASNFRPAFGVLAADSEDEDDAVNEPCLLAPPLFVGGLSDEKDDDDELDTAALLRITKRSIAGCILSREQIDRMRMRDSVWFAADDTGTGHRAEDASRWSAKQRLDLAWNTIHNNKTPRLAVASLTLFLAAEISN